jgi:hypothetical protein
MWALAAIVAFAVAVAVHAAIGRLPFVKLNMVSRFLAPGAPIGLALLIVLLARGAPPIELVAALLCYALACELYIFTYTMVSSSVTVSLLLRLRHGPADWHQLDADYSDETMVDGRLTKLVANGLIVSTTAEGYLPTARGEALVGSFDRLRRFFRQPGSAPSAPPAGERVATREPVGQDVG